MKAMHGKILDIATTLIAKHGFELIKKRHIAKIGCFANSTINYHFADRATLHAAVIERAIERDDEIVIAQAIGAKLDVSKAPESLKIKAREKLERFNKKGLI